MFAPLTPIRFLHRATELFASKVGVVSGARRFTYGEFGERCARLAGALLRLGLQPGDRVAYLSFNNHQLLEGYYGVVMAHGVVMPVNVRLSAPELTAILQHAEAKILFYEADFAPLVQALQPAVPSLQHALCLDGDYETLLKDAFVYWPSVSSIDDSSTAELFYTSGSTGTPKGVMLSHRTLYLHALSVATLYENIETMTDLHTIPLFHANGWGRPQASVMLGVRQVMVRRFDPSAVLQLIEQERATDMCLVPTMANALINAPDLGKYDVSSMRNIMIGGAASSLELIARMEKVFPPPCRTFAGYGLTETAPVLTSARPKGTFQPASEEERLRRLAMAGWPVPNVELRVVSDDMKSVPRDMQTIGEVVVQGNHLMSGYFKDPEATAAAFKDGWFLTGDMAVWDEEGYIHIVDRKKEIIISGGENISSIEIEKAIFAHPEVLECAVVAAPDEKWGEVPVAIVVRKPGSSLSADALLDFIGRRLARFKLPRLIEFRDEPLPKTGTGKIRKLELRERFWEGRERRVH